MDTRRQHGQTTVVLDVDQAEQILELLVICADLLHNSTHSPAELANTLTVCVLDESADVDRFVNQLAFSRRYLDSRLAAERRTFRGHSCDPADDTPDAGAA